MSEPHCNVSISERLRKLQQFQIQKFQSLKRLISRSIEAPQKSDDRLKPSKILLNLELLRKLSRAIPLITVLIASPAYFDGHIRTNSDSEMNPVRPTVTININLISMR